MDENQFYVYILTNKHNSVLYTGITNNLQRRMMEHKSGNGGWFTNRYKANKLVYFDCGDDVNSAIWREKQIKSGSRRKKINLINSINPEWKDLWDEFFK